MRLKISMMKMLTEKQAQMLDEIHEEKKELKEKIDEYRSEIDLYNCKLNEALDQYAELEMEEQEIIWDDEEVEEEEEDS